MTLPITATEMVFPDLEPPLPMPLLALAVSVVAYVAVALATPRGAGRP